MDKCKRCDQPVSGNYCANCGVPVQLKRIDNHYIQREIEHVLHLDRGIMHTIKELSIRPGSSIRQYITEDRTRLISPILFIILTSLAYSFINHAFHIGSGYINFSEDQPSAVGVIFTWIQEHYGYANIIMGVFIALWAKLFFRRSPYNLFEILVMLCFLMGMAMLILATFTLVQGLLHGDFMVVASIILLVYLIWSIGQFFNQRNLAGYFKAGAAYLMGMLTFSIAAILLGILVELALRH